MIRPLLQYFPVSALLLAGALLPTATPAPAQSVSTRAVRPAPPKKAPEPVGRKGRENLVIDGGWRFLTDPQNVGEQSNWAQNPPGETKEIPIPSLWTTQAAPSYSGVAWYWREFEPSLSWKTQTVRLRFEAVGDHATVWLNGEKLGQHEGGATPFEFNVTKKLRAGEKNLIAVRVEGEAKRGAGIWQGVLLMAHDEAYLSEVSLATGGLGQLTSSIVLQNNSDVSGGATLEGRVILANKPDKEIRRSTQNLSLTPGRNVTTMLTSVRGKNLHAWSLDTPELYTLQLAFSQGSDVLDTQQLTFGFREFGWKDNSITLNGLPITLKSLAPTFALPIVIASIEDTTRARASFQRLKEAGVTVLYLDAPPPELLHIADELGLLIVESPRSGQSPQAAFAELQTLVERDRSHPSVFAWRLPSADETAIKKIRTSDPSRFFLTGSGGAAKLYLLGQGGDPVALPDGLSPGV